MAEADTGSESDARPARHEVASVEELLVANLPGLRAYVRLKAGPLVRAREGASDIVQSTCRQVLAHKDRFRFGGEGHFRRWLYTTALRTILDKHDFHTAARRDVRRDAGGGDDDLLSLYAGFCTPSRVASAREQLERIETAIAALDEEERDVVLLSRIVGLSRAEIAAEMGRTEASVRNLLHRTLTKLSRELGR